jgi:hypothetical protein
MVSRFRQSPHERSECRYKPYTPGSGGGRGSHRLFDGRQRRRDALERLDFDSFAGNHLYYGREDLEASAELLHRNRLKALPVPITLPKITGPRRHRGPWLWRRTWLWPSPDSPSGRSRRPPGSRRRQRSNSVQDYHDTLTESSVEQTRCCGSGSSEPGPGALFRVQKAAHLMKCATPSCTRDDGTTAARVRAQLVLTSVPKQRTMPEVIYRHAMHREAERGREVVSWAGRTCGGSVRAIRETFCL